ncbi:MAG: DNA recombination protein RmuC [Paracoccaceae bacterium]|nr:DNA recombination protein RmuC [Paracoccaceae bacterium]
MLQQIMENLLGFLSLSVFGVIAFLFLWRFGKPSESKKPNTYSDKIFSELSVTKEEAAKFTALAEERKLEIVRLKGELSDLREKIDEQNTQLREHSNTITKIHAKSEAEHRAANEKIEMLTKVRREMEMQFKELAENALKAQGESFSKANIEKLEATLTPLKEHVGHFEKELRQVHEETVKDRERLKTEISQLSRRSEAISQEAISLTKALKGDTQIQGAWGEMVLENILERSGLRNGEEYETQAHRIGVNGERLRPDVVVRIPGGKSLVIDSKVSLLAYNEAVNAATDVDALASRKRHLTSIKNHINSLSAKGYQTAENSTVDYVILFVPIEGALSEALREDPALTEHALERNITIATPTTLMMALKTIANVWAVDRRNQNAELIANRAGKLYDKVFGFVQNMERVGERLEQAQDSYTQAFSQLSKGKGNVISQVESLKNLGAKTSKKINTEFDGSDDNTVKLQSIKNKF